MLISNGEAQKQFNRLHHQFLKEPYNIHLKLYTNKFNSFELFSALYSCWSEILIDYNLPPKMFMRPKFIFLSKLILVLIVQLQI